MANRRSEAVENQVQRTKGKKPRRKKNHRVLTTVVFSALFIYLIGFLLMFINKPSVGIETVNYGSIDVPATLRGIIVRDEIVVESSMDGTPEYNYSENEKVAKNALVCTVKNTGTTQVIEDEIKKIDKGILDIQKNRKDFSLFKEDIDRTEKNIETSIDSTLYKFINYNISDVYSLKNQIQTQINLRNQIWLAENTKSTAELSAERNQYESQLEVSQETVRTKYSGIFSLKIDNFEEIVTPQVRKDISAEQIKMTVQPQYISKSLAVSAGSPLFKIVKSNTWYVVSNVPNEVSATWKEGDYLDIYTTIEDEEKSVQVKIESMNIGDSTTYVVFVTDRNLIDFLELRTMYFSVKESVYSGFKVPNASIVERTFLKIPKTFLSNSLDEQGVIKRTSSGDTFQRIKIANSDENYVYVLQDFESLKIGDTIVGIGEGAQTYTIGEVATYKGVYVANSSLAEFTVIDILGQNSDYAIVNAESQFGLKVYDKIVSDAKAVQNEESVN
ncbi:MAG: HlyD family efflux transporter periplasmic adaptor subunit [Lachnospiraceae bacterium]|nr:HlyD family efflux transporter periplasmic adaptor subunit [Lachnospiraceae bacterium]